MIFLIAFFLLLLTMPFFIRFMRRLQIGEMIRSEGPESHQNKRGTPTMGGLLLIGVILLSAIIAILLKSRFIFRESYWILYMTFSFGMIGFIDDYRKTIRKTPYGLKARHHIILQIVFSIPFLWALGDANFLTYALLMIIAFELLVILSVSNSVNLTDGLDGLLAGIAIPIFGFYYFFSYHFAFPEISHIALIFLGALLAFLFYNFWPAKIFMGNTGSFAIGGAIAAMAILTKTEWYLLVLGGIFAIEAVSVILQVSYFKYSRKKTGEGRRIFRMAPIHHHFELLGYPEPLIVVRFWIFQLILTAVTWWITGISY